MLSNIDANTGVKAIDNLLQIGESVLFPNKFPFGENHGVAVSTRSHYVAMPDFTETQIKDCFIVCKEWIRLTSKLTRTVTDGDFVNSDGGSTISKELSYDYPIVVWNYMPPSAGSIIHPHMQVHIIYSI